MYHLGLYQIGEKLNAFFQKYGSNCLPTRLCVAFAVICMEIGVHIRDLETLKSERNSPINHYQ